MSNEELISPLAKIPFLLLVGGQGKRLKETTADKPKCLVDIAGEPFINHQLKLLAGKGASKIIILTGRQGEQIREVVGDGKQFNLDISFSDDGKKPLGTGGAVEKAAKGLSGSFAVMYGDTYLDIPMAAVFQRFEKCAQPALITVIENIESIRRQESNTSYDRSRMLINDYNKEKPSENMHHIEYGLSFFNADIFAKPEPKNVYDLGEKFKKLAKSGQLAGYEVQNRFYEINTPESLIETRAYLSRNNLF